jgi:hypothetical protein
MVMSNIVISQLFISAPMELEAPQSACDLNGNPQEKTPIFSQLEEVFIIQMQTGP